MLSFRGFVICFVCRLFSFAFFSGKIMYGPVAVTLSRVDMTVLDEFWNAARCNGHNSQGMYVTSLESSFDIHSDLHRSLNFF